MKVFERAFTPTQNRRLNELIGFLLLAAALLLFLALATYSPLDPSLNTAAPSASVSPARNWVGMVGALIGDLGLQLLGVPVFLLPVMIGLAGTRWFHSRPVSSPVAKTAGCAALLIFVPALLALLPFQWRWLGAVPMEGLLGRILGDVLIRYLNTAGAYIVALSVIAVALYLSTAFSFGALRLWMETRFAFGFAAWERWEEWRKSRAAARMQREMERRRRAQAAAAAQTTQRRTVLPPAASHKPQPAPLQASPAASSKVPTAPGAGAGSSPAPYLGARADSSAKAKTTLPKISGGFKLPSSSLLHRPEDQYAVDENELRDWAQVLTEKSAEFDVHGQVTHINPGPVVTTFEFKPDAGIKVSRITNLADDLCLALKAESILIERMPGKSTVGVQVPNRERETIWLREGIESQEFAASKSRLTLSMGKDINGRLVTADLTSMPHLLIAGATGTGKSVAINAMIMSMLYKATPEQVRFILVDPKRLELGIYEGVPHLYTPIITEPKLAAHVLRNACREMERRLKLLAEHSVRNIEQYNRRFGDEHTPSLFEKQDAEHRPLPYIVIVIDELADLMMLDRANVEESVTRLAQMARAVGIHLVLATQRPSVDVITGLIKANFPARISFRVATKVDSRTILDANGAEALLGRGDMLYLPAGSARVHRLHAPYVTEKEITAVVEFWRAQAQAQYDEKFLQAPKDKDEGAGSEGGAEGEGPDEEHDELYEDAVRLVVEFGKASTSLLQRRLRIGYGRAAHLIDLMEKDGIVGSPDGPRPREVLKKPDWLSEVEAALR